MVTVKFNEVDEYLEEMQRDAPDIERGIVRVTNMFRMSRASPNIRNVVLISTYVVKHQIVRLERYCGDVGMYKEEDSKVMAKAEEIQKLIATKCAELALQLRSGITE